MAASENPDLDAVEQILCEAYEALDQDTVYEIVKTIRIKLDRPKFALDVYDPDDDIEDIFGEDEEEEEGEEEEEH